MHVWKIWQSSECGGIHWISERLRVIDRIAFSNDTIEEEDLETNFSYLQNSDWQCYYVVWQGLYIMSCVWSAFKYSFTCRIQQRPVNKNPPYKIFIYKRIKDFKTYWFETHYFTNRSFWIGTISQISFCGCLKQKQKKVCVDIAMSATP